MATRGTVHDGAASAIKGATRAFSLSLRREGIQRGIFFLIAGLANQTQDRIVSEKPNTNYLLIPSHLISSHLIRPCFLLRRSARADETSQNNGRARWVVLRREKGRLAAELSVPFLAHHHHHLDTIGRQPHGGYTSETQPKAETEGGESQHHPPPQRQGLFVSWGVIGKQLFLLGVWRPSAAS